MGGASLGPLAALVDLRGRGEVDRAEIPLGLAALVLGQGAGRLDRPGHGVRGAHAVVAQLLVLHHHVGVQKAQAVLGGSRGLGGAAVVVEPGLG